MQISQFLWQKLSVIIDRPLGSKHPQHNFQYELNYWYVPDTMSADGEELDVYVLDKDTPIAQCTWTCIGYIQRINDDDDKLLIVTDMKNKYSEEDIRNLTNFQEKRFESNIILTS